MILKGCSVALTTHPETRGKKVEIENKR